MDSKKVVPYVLFSHLLHQFEFHDLILVEFEWLHYEMHFQAQGKFVPYVLSFAVL